MSSDQTGPRLPGEFGIWMFVAGNLVLFGLLFGTFQVYRLDGPAAYSQSSAMLNLTLGAVNTVLLLTSSYTVALGVHLARRGRWQGARTALLAGLCCGIGFCVLKILEYAEKGQAGIGVGTDDFFMFFFVMTGIHMVHVLIGLGVLSFLWFYTSRRQGDVAVRSLESGATYWHLVDLLWIVLFAQLYLLR